MQFYCFIAPALAFFTAFSVALPTENHVDGVVAVQACTSGKFKEFFPVHMHN